MMTRAFLLAAGLLAAGLVPASAEVVTATVKDWDQATRTLTLEDQSQFASIPATVAIAGEVKAGAEVTVDYEATDNGVASYNSITVTTDTAKRQLPPNKG